MTDVNQKLIGSILIGVSIILIFVLIIVKNNHDKEGAFLCKIVEENPDLSMEDCPAHESSVSWLIMVAFTIGLLILLTGVFLVFRAQLVPPEHKRAPAVKVDVSKLDGEEQQVVVLLQESSGSMYQSDIIKATGFSKVHMTRVLDKMEAKQVVERRRRGMTNLVVLK